MTMPTGNCALTFFKPDAKEAMRRMAAFWEGELIDRPPIKAVLRKEGSAPPRGSDYRRRVEGDMDEIIEDVYQSAGSYDYLGESFPAFWHSQSSHEVALYLGAKLIWQDGGGDTNWCEPCVEDWSQVSGLSIDENNAYYRRMLDFLSRGSSRFNGRILCYMPDLHTNMDMLMSLRGDEGLCLDAVDCPEQVDRVLNEALRIYEQILLQSAQAGNMDRDGYWANIFCERPMAILSCDFSALIGSEMFKRWVLPALEYEASLLYKALYHWDGPMALRHFDDLMSIDKIRIFSYVPNPHETHTQYLSLYQRVQQRGKAIEFTGTPDEIRAAHRELDPAHVVYTTRVESMSEYVALENWLRKNT